MKRIFRLVVAGGILLSASCNNYYDIEKDPITYGQTYFKPVINTDKAVYKPGEKITFTAAISDNNLSVAYTYLGELIKEEPLSQLSWTWTPPTTDFRGYMVYLFKTDDTTKKPLYSIAVDVSSDWRKFPRYGFVSNYDRLDQQVIQRNVETLNR
ncbi:MAG TPA: cycloisomaltooligosaccharide glucanotransferase, partial [Sphingobacterium sp.]|nr:cycloisomaltooligosaccharide glucanotransferase [Sphingobacterium sp.]